MVTDRRATAQATYTDMLRLEVAPRLRALGFTGSGSSFVLPADDWWQVVGFQKDRHSRADRVRFTVNLTVAGKAAWATERARDPSLPGRPSGNTRYAAASVTRLGLLLPPRHEDQWWEVVPGTSTTATATRISDAIERHALPWFRDHSAPR